MFLINEIPCQRSVDGDRITAEIDDRAPAKGFT
jgi:hypothetical protein